MESDAEGEFATMLLTGTYTRAVDEKQRIAIPKTLRDALAREGRVLYVAPGTDGCLSVYSELAFTQLAQRLAQASPTAREVREYSRLFYAQACPVELDRQGRIRIPQELAEWADLGKEVVLLGVQDRLEIWQSGRWETYRGEKLGRYDDIAEAAFGVARESPAEPADQPALLRMPK